MEVSFIAGLGGGEGVEHSDDSKKAWSSFFIFVHASSQLQSKKIDNDSDIVC
jgi:hypothetical protein